jgi:hypothetical protein
VAGNISITFRESNLFATAGGLEWIRPEVVNVEYRNSEGAPYSQITFAQPIEICFAVTPEQWQDYNERQQGYQVQFYAEQQDPPRWESLPGKSYAERLQICGLTDHLSLFALAIQQEAIILETGATPTQDLYAP